MLLWLKNCAAPGITGILSPGITGILWLLAQTRSPNPGKAAHISVKRPQLHESGGLLHYVYCLDCVVCHDLIPQTPLYVKSPENLSGKHCQHQPCQWREGGERILAISPAAETAPGTLHGQVTQRVQVAVRMPLCTPHCGAKQRLSLAAKLI